MVGRPWHGRKVKLTKAESQKRWRDKKKRLAKGALKRERREERMKAMDPRNAIALAVLETKQPVHNVIYADPPWRFEPWSRISGMDRAADNHYESMSLEEIKALRVPAAPDCVLFLWATQPMLPQALEVMAAWGFTYVSHWVWEKDGIGLGCWSRNVHELLLIGTRGDVPAPLPGEQLESIIQAPRGEHSAKPEVFARIIEQMFPSVPKLEMFARSHRPGWDVWGAEVMAEAAEWPPVKGLTDGQFQVRPSQRACGPTHPERQAAHTSWHRSGWSRLSRLPGHKDDCPSSGSAHGRIRHPSVCALAGQGRDADDPARMPGDRAATPRLVRG
jgi:N6-adenosine-specific RNA methylase IME4